jgi:hypothetical protein
VTVHDIDVDPVGAASLRRRDGIAQARKIG